LKTALLAVFLALFSTVVVLRFVSSAQPCAEETESLMNVDLPVHNIDSGKNFATIQEAMNDNETLGGHTILVEQGIYHEHVVINKSISLIGEDREATIIDGNEIFTPILHITANNVTIRAFTIQDSGRIYGWEGGGIYITDSNEINIINNTIANTQYGINLRNSTNNSIFGNTIVENDVGIQFIELSTNNTIYHNNFNNGLQTYRVNIGGVFLNTWDNHYPSGGNYWSDYAGVDMNKGSGQNKTGSDGLGDTPLIIDQSNRDRYPLMKAWNWPILGDINYNFNVDMKDVGAAAKAYDSRPGNLLWNPHADITGLEHLVPDNRVDMRDIGLIARNFGETYP